VTRQVNGLNSAPQRTAATVNDLPGLGVAAVAAAVELRCWPTKGSLDGEVVGTA
jgi:hypothetical protein